MVLMSALLIVLVSITNKIKNRICDCGGVVVTAPALKSVNERLNENTNQKRAVNADTLSVDDAARELQKRYHR